MASIISYNQLIEFFKAFADAHPQINDFGAGPTSEIGTSKQMKFPYLWVTHRGPSNLELSANKVQTPQMSLAFIFVDQLNNQTNYLEINGQNSNNEQEVLSDQFQIAQDFVNYILIELNRYGVNIREQGASIEPVYDETPDTSSGWVLDLTLTLKHSNCVTPLGDVIINVPITPPAIRDRYLTCDTLTTCDIIQDIQSDIIAISGATGDNFFTTGATLSGNTIIFNRNDLSNAYSLDLTSILPTDNFTTGATLSNGVISFNRTDTSNAYSVNITSITDNFLPLTGGTLTGSLSATTYFGDGSNLTGILSTDNFTTGGTYNSVTEEIDFVGTNTATTFSVDVSALVGGGSTGSTSDAITSIGNIEENLFYGWNSPIKFSNPARFTSAQFIERTMHIQPIVVKDGRLLNDFMFQIATTSNKTLDFGVYNAETYTITSGLNNLNSIRPKDLLGSVTGIDCTVAGVKILTDLNINLTGTTSNVYYLVLANFSQTGGGNPNIVSMTSEIFGGQLVLGNGKFLFPETPTNLNQMRGSEDMKYFGNLPLGLTSFPTTNFISTIGLEPTGLRLTTGSAGEFMPYFFWR